MGTAWAPHGHRMGTAWAPHVLQCTACALHITSVHTAHASARRPAARALLHKLLPEVVDNAGALRRVPSAEEVRCVRARLFALAAEEQPAGEATGEAAQAGEATGEAAQVGEAAGEPAQAGEAAGEADQAMAAMILKFEEFYFAGGCLDLLFHPQEAHPLSATPSEEIPSLEGCYPPLEGY